MVFGQIHSNPSIFPFDSSVSTATNNSGGLPGATNETGGGGGKTTREELLQKQANFVHVLRFWTKNVCSRMLLDPTPVGLEATHA
jgi:hypothetical protein